MTNNIFIREFLLPSRCFKKGQHPTSMIQNVVLFNSRGQPTKTCLIQINISSKLQRSLQDKLCTTHVTPSPPLHFVQVQICYPCNMRSTLIHQFVDPATLYEESQGHCIKYQNIDIENMQSCVHWTPSLKHTYHPSMQPLESHQVSMVYNLRHLRQPQQLRYQQWHFGVPTKHAKSPWENNTSKKPF
jgi:hypothetical protein